MPTGFGGTGESSLFAPFVALPSFDSRSSSKELPNDLISKPSSSCASYEIVSFSIIHVRKRPRGTYLVTHCKSPVVRRWAPEICNEREIDQVNDIEPTVEDKPS